MKTGTRLGKAHWDDRKDFTDAWKYTVEDAATCGQQYVINPWLDDIPQRTTDDLKRYMESVTKVGNYTKVRHEIRLSQPI